MKNFSNKLLEFIRKYITGLDSKVENKSFIDILSSIDVEFDYQKLLSQINNLQLEAHKNQSLEFLIAYSKILLEDNNISQEEHTEFTFLKKILKIQEGDFIKFKKNEIQEIIQKHISIIYSDNKVDTEEAIFKVNLQSLFNLGYDELYEMKKEEVIKSLKLGANPTDLDIPDIPIF